MTVFCGTCKRRYDDAQRSTICPHRLIMPLEDLARKDAGLALLGKLVRFNHQPDGPWRPVQAVQWNGMVEVEGMTGEFAPHLFVVKTSE